MHEKLRDRLLGAWAGLVCDHPWWVLLSALVIAAACIASAVTSLGFQPDRNALISEELDWNARYIEFRKRFAHDALTIVVEVPADAEAAAGAARARQAVRQIADRLSSAEHVARFDWQIESMRPSAALRMLDGGEFEQAVNALAATRVLIRSPNLPSAIAAAPAALSEQSEQSEQGGAGAGEHSAEASTDAVVAQIGAVAHLIDTITLAMQGKPHTALSAHLSRITASEPRFLTSDDQTLLFVQVEPTLADDQLEPVAPAVAELRRIIDDVKAAHPGVGIGLTGVPVIEADETEVTQRDATLASLLAVAVIAVMLVIAFHSVHLPGLAVAALLIGIAWSFGYLTLAIGHLQLLSVVFTVFLLGLGIDFGIHLITRFELVRDQFPPGVPGFRGAMTDTLRTAGPGIATGAFTTAVAFGATLLTDFQGMAEMGHIAGVGIVLCLVSMLAVLPAMMRLLRPRRRHVKPVDQRGMSLYQHHWWDPFYKRPAVTVLVALVLTFVGGYFAQGIRYDYNLSNLLPRHVESVAWFNRIATGGEQGEAGGSSVWFGASVIEIDRRDEAEARVRQFRRSKTVADVGGFGLLFPKNDDAKKLRLLEVRESFEGMLDRDARLPLRPPTTMDCRASLGALRLAVGFALQRDDVRQNPAIAAALEQIKQAISRADGAVVEAGDAAATKLMTMHQAFIVWRGEVRAAIADATSNRDLVPTDLPQVVRRIALSGDGHAGLIQVFPKGDVYDPDQLEPFIDALMKVDPDITGTAVQVHQSARLMVSSYVRAGLIALAAVFALVLLDFQRPMDALLCLVPVGMAFIMLLGLLTALGMAINPANILVLPLLFGIGVDHGVHIVHRYRAAPDEHPPGLAAGTGKGIMLTSLTSVIGFASMLIADHRGIQSLGLTLALGMLLTMVVCLTVMPAILEVRSRKYGVDAGHKPVRAINGGASSADDADDAA